MQYKRNIKIPSNANDWRKEWQFLSIWSSTSRQWLFFFFLVWWKKTGISQSTLAVTKEDKWHDVIQSWGCLFCFSSQEVLRVTAGKETGSCMKDSMVRFPVASMDCHQAYMNKALTIIVPDHSWYFNFERKVVVNGRLKCQQKFAISCGDFLLQKRKTVVSLQFWAFFWTFCWKFLSEPLMCTIKFFSHTLGEAYLSTNRLSNVLLCVVSRHTKRTLN